MKGLILLLCALAVLTVTQTAVVKAPASRASLSWGYPDEGDSLLDRQVLYTPAISGEIQTQDYVFQGNATTYISSVQALEIINNYANARIVAGGLGYNHVTVRVNTLIGFGFNYRVSVWGR